MSSSQHGGWLVEMGPGNMGLSISAIQPYLFWLACCIVPSIHIYIITFSGISQKNCEMKNKNKSLFRTPYDERTGNGTHIISCIMHEWSTTSIIFSGTIVCANQLHTDFFVLLLFS